MASSKFCPTQLILLVPSFPRMKSGNNLPEIIQHKVYLYEYAEAVQNITQQL